MPRLTKTTRCYLIEGYYFDPKAKPQMGLPISRHAYRIDLAQKPTDADAETTRQELNRSFQKGGENAAKSVEFGFQPHIYTLQIRNANTGVRVALAKAPTFEVTG